MKITRALLASSWILIFLGYSCQDSSHLSPVINDPLKNQPSTPTSAVSSILGTVIVKSMNFRTAPSPDAPLVNNQSAVYWRTRFRILEEQGEWARIQLYDGTEGWLRSIYEGKLYIQKTSVDNSDRIPIDSHQFYGLVIPMAKQWDDDSKLDFLYGEDGGLDGRCSNWVALFYTEAKPNQKLMCEYTGGKELTKEIWEVERFEYLKQNTDGLPGYWWQNEGTYAQPGFINSSDLCTAKNLEPFLNWKMDVTAPLHQEGFRCRFILGKDDWTISIGAILTSCVYMSYDAKTGKLRKTDSNDEPMTGSEG